MRIEGRGRREEGRRKGGNEEKEERKERNRVEGQYITWSEGNKEGKGDKDTLRR